MFAAARCWLLGLIGHSSSGAHILNLDALMKALVGLWTCELLLGFESRSEQFLSVLRGVEVRLQVSTNTVEAGEHDTKLLLLTLGLLRGHGCCAQSLEQFGRRLSTALREVEGAPQSHRTVTWLLYQLGYELALVPTPVMTWADFAGGPSQLIRADVERIRSVCSAVCEATHYGQRSLVGSAQTIRHLSHILTAILVQTCRGYDLETACLLLRSIHYLPTPRGITVRQGIDFLMNQQQAEGRFGLLSRESEKLRAVDAGTNVVNSRLYLPVTVSCIWTLAESLEPSFNLFSSVMAADADSHPTDAVEA